MKPNTILGRRTLLGGTAASLALAPFIPLLESEADAHGKAPVRAIIYWHQLGWLPNDFDGFKFNEIQKPLEPMKDKLLFIQGADLKAAIGTPSDHPQKVGTILTSRVTSSTQFATNSGPGWDPHGPSIDQALADKLKGQTRYDSMTFGVKVGNYAWKTLFDLEGQAIKPENDPKKARERLFGDTTGMMPDGADALARQQRRLSVIDYVKGELDAVTPRVSVTDRHKIDQHLTFIRENEIMVQQPPVAAADCSDLAGLPSQAIHDTGGNEGDYSSVARQHMDTIAHAFSCDQTRVAAVQWDLRGLKGSNYSNTHGMSHNKVSHNEAYTAFGKFNAVHFAYLLQALDKVPEGSGTMLDNTVVLWTSEHALTGNHRRTSVPTVIGGSGGGYFKTGQHVDVKGTSMTNVFLSVAEAMGITMETFGDPKWSQGPLAALR